eukprot:maker-scaffold12_size759060-snap-gene-6.21 protein:Tk05589 transcript:maker-scaffold12_size759060-snap-gene-6.21-mRNA-1 annotation:"nadh dehydrogenase 1 alpha subcomplex subunit mitochondrial precursor"
MLLILAERVHKSVPTKMATPASKTVKSLGQTLHKIGVPSTQKLSTSCVDQAHDVPADRKGDARIATMRRGPGYRSSFSGTVATVFGATGLVGRSVCSRLGKIGSQMILPYHRDHYTFMRLKVCGDLGQVLFNPYSLQDEESIRESMKYSNVVINLVGRQWETRNFSFQDINVEAPAKMARIAREMGVKRFIHISDINARENPKRVFLPGGSKYLRTKWEGEQRVLEEFPDATIFRPTELYGIGDAYLKYYFSTGRLALNSSSLALWKKGNYTVKAPLHFSDLGHAIVNSLTDPEAKGNIYEAFGPERYLLSELMDYIFTLTDRDPQEYGFRRVDLRFSPTTFAVAAVIERMPIGRKYFGGSTIDRLERSSLTDEVLGLDNLADLGVTPASLIEKMPWECKPFRAYAHYEPELYEEIPIPIPRPVSRYEEKEIEMSQIKGNPIKNWKMTSRRKFAVDLAKAGKAVLE